MHFAKPALLGAALGVLFAANLRADTLFSNLGQTVNGVGWQITSSHAADPGSACSLIVDTQAQYSGDSGDMWIDNFPYEFQFSLLPEPDQFAQLGAGLLLLGLLCRRKV